MKWRSCSFHRGTRLVGTEAAIVHVQYWHDVECMVLCLSCSTVTCLIVVAFFHHFFVFPLLSMFCILVLLVVKNQVIYARWCSTYWHFIFLENTFCMHWYFLFEFSITLAKVEPICRASNWWVTVIATPVWQSCLAKLLMSQSIFEQNKYKYFCTFVQCIFMHFVWN